MTHRACGEQMQENVNSRNFATPWRAKLFLRWASRAVEGPVLHSSQIGTIMKVSYDTCGLNLMCSCYDVDIQENLATSITSPLFKSMSTSIVEPEGADFFVR